MKLYQFALSPFAAKVRKCLELKGLAHDVIEVPFLDRRELMAVTGGTVMIPVLVDGSTIVTDSPRITAYLDDRYPPSLRPGALAGPARVFEEWADNLLEDIVFRLTAPTSETKIAALNGGRDDARALWRISKERKYGAGCLDAWKAAEAGFTARLTGATAPLGRTLEHQPFLLGDQPTLADAAVWGQLFPIECLWPGRLATLAPGLADWFRRLGALRP